MYCFPQYLQFDFKNVHTPTLMPTNQIDHFFKDNTEERYSRVP